MLTDYINAAMKQAEYEILEDGTFLGKIPPVRGVLSNQPTLEACRDELESVLEGWILLSLWRHMPIPVIDGIDLNMKKEVAA